jgi:hypothetical protein
MLEGIIGRPRCKGSRQSAARRERRRRGRVGRFATDVALAPRERPRPDLYIHGLPMCSFPGHFRQSDARFSTSVSWIPARGCRSAVDDPRGRSVPELRTPRRVPRITAGRAGPGSWPSAPARTGRGVRVRLSRSQDGDLWVRSSRSQADCRKARRRAPGPRWDCGPESVDPRR